MESKENAMTILNTIAILYLLIGLMLDYLTIFWAYKSAKKEYYKSGNFLIPAILYICSILFINIDFINDNKILVISILVLMHLFIYFFASLVFEKYVNR